MECVDCVSLGQMVSALLIGISGGGATVLAVNYYLDIKRDRVIMALQRSYADRNKRNKMNKKI